MHNSLRMHSCCLDRLSTAKENRRVTAMNHFSLCNFDNAPIRSASTPQIKENRLRSHELLNLTPSITSLSYFCGWSSVICSAIDSREIRGFDPIDRTFCQLKPGRNA